MATKWMAGSAGLASRSIGSSSRHEGASRALSSSSSILNRAKPSESTEELSEEIDEGRELLVATPAQESQAGKRDKLVSKYYAHAHPGLSASHGRPTLPNPKPIPKTHGILVATLEMHANFVENLEFYSQWCYLSARSFGMPACRPDRLPRTKELITVPKSPFVHKKFQENFQKLTFKRMIRVYDTSPQTLDLWLRYIARNSLGGITMKVKMHEWVDYGFGSKEIESLEMELDQAPTQNSDAIRHRAYELLKKMAGKEEADRLMKPALEGATAEPDRIMKPPADVEEVTPETDQIMKPAQEEDATAAGVRTDGGASASTPPQVANASQAKAKPAKRASSTKVTASSEESSDHQSAQRASTRVNASSKKSSDHSQAADSSPNVSGEAASPLGDIKSTPNAESSNPSKSRGDAAGLPTQSSPETSVTADDGVSSNTDSTSTPDVSPTAESTSTPDISPAAESTSTPAVATAADSTSTPDVATAVDSTSTPVISATTESSSTPDAVKTADSTSTPFLSATTESASTPDVAETAESTSTPATKDTMESKTELETSSSESPHKPLTETIPEVITSILNGTETEATSETAPSETPEKKKSGRPKKVPDETSKTKAPQALGSEGEPLKRKPGRPKKTADETPKPTKSKEADSTSGPDGEPMKKGPGRPKKAVDESVEPVVKKPRGRPRKDASGEGKKD